MPVLATDALFVDVPAQALEAGSSGNVVAGAVCVMTACPVGITACTNPQAFSGGSDPEEDESLRQRILESYQRLPNGANASYYQQVAMSHTGVAAATVVGRARGIGTVDVYIATEAGIPDGELLAEVTQDLAEKREIAVDVQVLAPETKTVDITLELDAGDADFDDLRLRVEARCARSSADVCLGEPSFLQNWAVWYTVWRVCRTTAFTHPLRIWRHRTLCCRSWES